MGGVCYRPRMISTLLPALAVFGPAVAVGVLLAAYGNDGAATTTAAGVLLMTWAEKVLAAKGVVTVLRREDETA